MINNFFQVALKMDRFSSDFYTEQIRVVYDFIEKYWKKNKLHLSTSPFDLEECFTFIDLQLRDAIEAGDRENMNRLREIKFRLTTFLAEVLGEFVTVQSVENYEVMPRIGILLHKEKPIIITFNYDDFIETAL